MIAASKVMETLKVGSRVRILTVQGFEYVRPTFGK